MKKIILILAAMMTFAACTKEGDVIYQTDPADAPSTNAVGDGNYNDLIYQSVEQAAKEHGLRTMHLSPSTRAEGLAYLETLFQQMSAAQDTVRRLFIVAAASYDDYVRRNNDRLAANPYTDLLYLETSEPLDGKGSTLCLPYYGAMYEAGGLAQSLASEVLLVAANPKVESVSGAVDGFTDARRSSPNISLTTWPEASPWPTPQPYTSCTTASGPATSRCSCPSAAVLPAPSSI